MGFTRSNYRGVSALLLGIRANRRHGGDFLSISILHSSFLTDLLLTKKLLIMYGQLTMAHANGRGLVHWSMRCSPSQCNSFHRYARQHCATNHEQLPRPPPKQPEQTDQFQESHRTVHIPRTVLEARRCGSVDWSRSSADSFHPVPNLPHPT